MEPKLPKRWKVAVLAALASGLASFFASPELGGTIAQILGALL